MRVLISGHLPPPMGGIAAYFQAVMSSSLGERVILRFVQSSSQKRSFAESGKFSLSNLTSAAVDISRFSRAVISFRPEVVHIATAYGQSFLKHGVCAAIARIFGCRVLLHPHCSFSVLYTQRPEWWKSLVRRVFSRMDGVLALSSEWLELEKICPSVRVYILSNAIDLRSFTPVARTRQELTEDHWPLEILYLGHLGREKGSNLLVEASRLIPASCPAFAVHLVGEELSPGELNSLRQAVEKNNVGSRVFIHPPEYGREKVERFSRSDIFCYPSFHEGAPIAVMEAMACGLPVVATRVGGLPDLVADGISGVLVEPGDSSLLAQALSRLLEDPPLRRSMQQAGARIASERFDVENHVQTLVGIYQKVRGSAPASLTERGKDER